MDEQSIDGHFVTLSIDIDYQQHMNYCIILLMNLHIWIIW